MSPKPQLSVRAPRNPEEFVQGPKTPEPIVPLRPVAPLVDDTPQNSPALAPEAATTSSSDANASTTPMTSGRRPKMRGVVKRADGDERARVTVYLDLDVAAKLRRHCFENALELSVVTADAIKKFVSKLP